MSLDFLSFCFCSCCCCFLGRRGETGRSTKGFEKLLSRTVPSNTHMHSRDKTTVHKLKNNFANPFSDNPDQLVKKKSMEFKIQISYLELFYVSKFKSVFGFSF